jgi:hypothetical protein
VAELWLPGVAGPQDEFVDRLHRSIERFAREAGVERAYVQVVLQDGSRFTLDSISAEPGFGFVTLRPHPDDSEAALPEAMLVPVVSIKRLELDRAEEQRADFGFHLPE